MKKLASALAALILGCALAAQAKVDTSIEASLTPFTPFVASGEQASFTLQIRVLEDTDLDAAVFDGVFLEFGGEGIKKTKVGKKGGRKVSVAAGTTILRTGIVADVPVKSKGGLQLVSVRWPDLTGAVTSLEVAPMQSTIDVDALDLAESRVVLVTAYGTMVLGFMPEVAPNHVRNFLELSAKGFYDGTAFHRILRGFMVQGGCPNTKEGADGAPGTGDPGYSLDAEFSETRHLRGVVSMARSPGDVNSAGCQFFICHGDSSHLDNNYSAFGKVLEGFETLDEIAEVPVSKEGEGSTPLTPVRLHQAFVLPVFANR